jgi:DNA topoisomerase-2
MIIDGQLVVSKKKKAVLMAELKKLNFKPFSKTEDATNAGEIVDTLGNDDEAEEHEDTETGSRDYDYLLGVSGYIMHVNSRMVLIIS